MRISKEILLVIGILPILALSSVTLQQRVDFLEDPCVNWDAENNVLDFDNLPDQFLEEYVDDDPRIIMGSGGIPIMTSADGFTVIHDSDSTKNGYLIDLLWRFGVLMLGMFFGFFGAFRGKGFFAVVGMVLILAFFFPFSLTFLFFIGIFAIGMIGLIWREANPSNSSIISARILGTISLLSAGFMLISEVLEQYILTDYMNLLVFPQLEIPIVIALILVGMYSWLRTSKLEPASV